MGLCFVKFVVWLFIVSVGSEGKIAGRATCESTGLGEPARVTCHYRDNVVETSDVNAVSLLRDTGAKLEKVVECDRFLNNGFDCIPKAGYKLNGTISDQMIINITRARSEHQGTYYCELRIQQTEVQMGSCDLQYKEPDDATISKTPSEWDDEDQLNRDTGTSNVILWVIAVSVIILVLLVTAALVFVGVLFLQKRLRLRQKRMSRATYKCELRHDPGLDGDTDDSGCRYKDTDINIEDKLPGPASISKHVGALSDNSKKEFAIGKSSTTDDFVHSVYLFVGDSMRPHSCTNEANSAEEKKPYYAEHNAQSGDHGTFGVKSRQNGRESDKLDDANSETEALIKNDSESVDEVSVAANQDTSSIEGTKPHCAENDAHKGDQETYGVTVNGDSGYCANSKGNGLTADELTKEQHTD